MSQNQETQEISLDDLWNSQSDLNPEPKEDKNIIPESAFTQEEKETSPIVEKPQPEEQKQTFTTTSDYTDLIKEYVAEGVFPDNITIEVDGEDVLITDLKNVNKTLFKKIQKGVEAYKKDQDKDKFISVDGLDETTKQLIELSKKGGDISSLIKHKAEFVNPIENLDLENPQAQEWLVRQKLQSKGIVAEIIDTTIAVYKKNFKLDEEANKAKSEIDLNYQAEVKRRLAEQEAENTAFQEVLKERKKSLTEGYKTLGIQKDTTIKTLVDAATKADENGLTKTDLLYFQAKENPELYTKINYLLNNSAEFEEFMGIKTKNKEQVKTFIKIATTEKKTTTSAPQEEELKNWGDLKFSEDEK